MSNPGKRIGSAALIDGWQSFWFRPEPMFSLGLVRMAFGALMTGWTLSLLPDLYEFFGVNGVAPRQPSRPFGWGVFELMPSDHAVLIGCCVLLVSSIALTVGWHSRLAAILVFMLAFSFQRRDPSVFNSGDALIRLQALVLALAPSGAACSLDRWRSAGSFWSAEVRAPWTIRLLQVELSLIYLSSVRIKMAGELWPNGTAVSYALRLKDMLIMPTPHWLSANALVVNAVTWGTLALELAIGVLVWNRRLRSWVLYAGVAMHLSIMVTIGIGFFSVAMFVLYLAFVPPDTVQRLPGVIRRRVRLLRRRSAELPTSAPPQQEESGAVAETDQPLLRLT